MTRTRIWAATILLVAAILIAVGIADTVTDPDDDVPRPWATTSEVSP